jgi:hypothetical protein
MAKINEFYKNIRLDDLDEEVENHCDMCHIYDLCFDSIGDIPNYLNCFLEKDDDKFYESDEDDEEYVWKEMSYNKYKETL